MRVRLKGLVMMLVVVGEEEVISEPENPTLKCQPPSNWAESYPTAMKTRAACFCITTVRASSQSWHPCGVIQSERGQFSFVQWGVGQSREHLDIWSSGHFATTSLGSTESRWLYFPFQYLSEHSFSAVFIKCNRSSLRQVWPALFKSPVTR